MHIHQLVSRFSREGIQSPDTDPTCPHILIVGCFDRRFDLHLARKTDFGWPSTWGRLAVRSAEPTRSGGRGQLGTIP